MDCLDCKICHVPYDEEDHRPRNSSCGHEICTACLKALINNGTFMCPKCRVTSEVNHPDDLPVNFGLIDVIRAFKMQNISSTQKSEVCYEHLKDIKYRCLRCETWLCEECLDQGIHPSCYSSMYNNIVGAPYAMSSMKEKHTKDIRSLLTCFMEKVNYVPSLIQDHIDKIQLFTDEGEGIIKRAEVQKKEILDKAEKQCKDIMEVAETRKEELFERAKKRSEEMENLCNLLEQGNKHNEKLVEWDNYLQSTCSSYRMLDNTEMLTEIQQLMKKCLQNLEAYTLLPMLKVVKENKEVYFEILNKGERMYGKLSQYEENIYFNYLQNKTISDNSITIPFPRLHPMIHEASLIFLELSLGEVVKGRVFVRLNKNNPNIRKNMVDIVTGKSGKSLAGIELGAWDRNEIRNCSNLPFNDIPITPGGKKETGPDEKCNVVGYYGEGYLRIMYFSVNQRHSGSSGQYAIGYIESGSEILKWCCHKLFECTKCNCIPDPLTKLGHSCVCPSKRCKITDCGLVIEKQELD